MTIQEKHLGPPPPSHLADTGDWARGRGRGPNWRRETGPKSWTWGVGYSLTDPGWRQILNILRPEGVPGVQEWLQVTQLEQGRSSSLEGLGITSLIPRPPQLNLTEMWKKGLRTWEDFKGRGDVE